MPKTVDLDLGDLEEAPNTGPLQYYHAPFYSALKGCEACPIRQEARQVVPGDGPEDAEFLFLGQNPGDDEDKDGRSFIGKAGRELDKWLDALGLSRERVVISNAVKCHTRENREPRASEVDFCRDLWLPKELEYLSKVSVIIPLGNPASKAVLGKAAQTTAAFQIYWATVKLGGREFTVYPVAHPAYVLRSTANKQRMYNPNGLLVQLRTVLQRQHSEAYERARISQ